ncbi:MAG: alkaline phosphatase family protein [Rhodanobacteraceae bacterium]
MEGLHGGHGQRPHARVRGLRACRHRQPRLDQRRHAHRPLRRQAQSVRVFPFDHRRCDILQATSRANKNLQRDLQQVATTPNYAFVTPDLCHDGHNSPCVNGEPGGLTSADKFLRTWVPRIIASPAFRKDGILIITFDESDTADTTACCGEQPLPGGPKPGRRGPGGGRIGALVLSPFVKPGTVSSQPYKHYSTLRSVEQWFGLPYLGYAQSDSVPVFGPDVFTAWTPSGHTGGDTATQR